MDKIHTLVVEFDFGGIAGICLDMVYLVYWGIERAADIGSLSFDRMKRNLEDRIR